MKKILLVEDDSFILDVYSTHLKKQGYKVHTAKNVISALANIKNNRPDLLVLDMNLSNDISGQKDGLIILKEIKHNLKIGSMKIIVVSNYSLEDSFKVAELASLGVMKSFLKVESGPEEITNEIKEILK